MNFRTQQYIGNLLESVAEGQISSDEFRITFAKLREKLGVAEDFEAELKKLYQVANFSEFALCFLWIAEAVEQDPSKLEYTPSEQAFVVGKFREAVGETTAPPVSESPAAGPPQPTFTPTPEPTENPFGEQVAEQPAAPPVEELPEMPAHLQMETAGHIDRSEQDVYAAPPSPTSGTESEFAGLVEKFVEAMQGGSDERTSLFDSILHQAGTITAIGSGYPDDIREFCQYLIEFLGYVRENGFMDDVRVMNILSNISSPVTSWAGADPASREGLLAEGSELLRMFKSLFE